MKKIISLLSVLTISGTAVPTTIAASSYQKEETKLKNNDNNYQQRNNLENLSRVKRQNNNIFTTETLNFDFSVKNFKNYIVNINLRDYSKDKWNEVLKLKLSDKCDQQGIAWMCYVQKIGITFYLNDKTKKWHIQIPSLLWIDKRDTYSGGASWIWLGKGIKLT